MELWLSYPKKNDLSSNLMKSFCNILNIIFFISWIIWMILCRNLLIIMKNSKIVGKWNRRANVRAIFCGGQVWCWFANGEHFYITLWSMGFLSPIYACKRLRRTRQTIWMNRWKSSVKFYSKRAYFGVEIGEFYVIFCKGLDHDLIKAKVEMKLAT